MMVDESFHYWKKINKDKESNPEVRTQIEASIKRSKSLKPKCIKNNRPKGVGYSSLGWLIPCCWVDPRRSELDTFHIMDNPLFAAMFTEELKLSNVEKIEEIVYSEPWKNFGRALLHEPEKCPAECHKYCGVDLPDDGFVYQEHNKGDINKLTEEATNDKKLISRFPKIDNKNKRKHPKYKYEFGGSGKKETESIYNVPVKEGELSTSEDDGLRRYRLLKHSGVLPKNHYTDEEWTDLNRLKKYHDWVTDENRPMGGSHQHQEKNRDKLKAKKIEKVENRDDD